jgi:sulfite exporter TauE/SafE
MTTSRPSAFGLGIVLGIALIVLGISAYALSDFASITALIPALFGALVAGLSVVGYRRTERQRLAASGIGLLAVIGVLGSTRGIPDVLALLTGGAVDSPIAAVSQGLMIAVCLVLVATVIPVIRETRTTTSS